MIERLKALIGKLETRTLVLLVALAAASWLFLVVAGEVSEGGTDALDRELLLALRTPGQPSDPLGPSWLEEAVRDITALGGFTVLTLLTIVATLLLVFHQRRREALIFAATVVAAQASSQLLKAFYERERPALVAHGSYAYSHSFPSGHSAMAAAVFLILATVVASVEPRRRTKALIYGLAIVSVLGVGVSRVYLGVHWPTDVLGGWVLGASWALAAWLLLALTEPGKN
ncbi:undecaprenyl-diphosphatase [Phenylobacterium haematophilum]|uniref:Undecaprenyl-diphosphatase n=1 Tax=Phenylobacterium haematophilum TaxID=98513 RepID=A0A839ZWH5_9CAUL|nr:phosphatase PAP2 family protein [Phenylobacterium haematophilum]MBB3890404.1 undecaprenyl-diphosphatase [Phenylobacterium haematophilum]